MVSISGMKMLKDIIISDSYDRYFKLSPEKKYIKIIKFNSRINEKISYRNLSY